MAIEYAIEKLISEGDRQHAAVLAGVLAARNGVDVDFPAESAVHLYSHDSSLASGTGRIALADSREISERVVNSDELEADTTERYALSNAAKSLLQPYYEAAVLKLPLQKDEPKSIFGNVKSGVAQLDWQAESSVDNPRTEEVKYGRESPVLGLRHKLGISYLRSKSGNTPTEFSVETSLADEKVRRNSPTLKLILDNAAVESVHFERGNYDNAHRSLALPTILDEVLNCDISLDPSNLGLSFRYLARGKGFDSADKKFFAKYAYNSSTQQFETSEQNKPKVDQSHFPTVISKGEFFELIQTLADSLIPTK